MKHVFIILLAGVAAGMGCTRYGPEPETVPYVDVTRYAGLWHEIATNPVFFNKDLVGVTAEYAVINDRQISVLNTGYKGSLQGKKDSIAGTATVVDTTTNSKLIVEFDRFLGWLFKGNYWIVALDAENYQWAVVTDNRQFTLFILSREPEMDQALYDAILAELQEKSIDLSRLKITGKLR